MDKSIVNSMKSLGAIEVFSEMMIDIAVMDNIDQRRALIEILAGNIKRQAGEAKESINKLITSNTRQADVGRASKSPREIDLEKE